MEQDQQTNQDRQQQQQPELNGRPQAVASDTDGEGSVSLKRKFDLLQDSSGTSPTPSAQNGELDVEVDSEGDHQQSHQQQTSSSAAQRALIARTAPHLLESQNASPSPSNSTNQSYSPRSNSRSRSSTPSREDLIIQGLMERGGGATGIGIEDGADTPGGSGSGSEDRAMSTTEIPSSGKGISSHKVPLGYRGPLPRFGDAEDLAPLPALIPIPNSSTLFNTRDFPLNRNGYRYSAAGPSSHELVQSVYKSIETSPSGIHWSWSDRSTYTQISSSADVVSTAKGFRSARSNVGIREGKWYVEIEVLGPEGGVGVGMGDGPHVRLGFGRREAQLNAPVGFDAYSYGIRDKKGDKVTMSRCTSYGEEFGIGDVVGLYISIPTAQELSKKKQQTNSTTTTQDKIRRKRLPIRYKGQLYFEQLEYAQCREMESLMERVRKGQPGIPDDLAILGNIDGRGAQLAAELAEKEAADAAKKKGKNSKASKKIPLRPLPQLKGSKIGFFVNGKCFGTAFEDLFDFRPLTRPPTPKSKYTGTSTSGKHPNQHTKKAVLPQVEGEEVSAVITSSSSLAAIMKARENAFDDGAMGYFPFVSCFGGARARIIAGPEFRFEPGDSIDEEMERVDLEKRRRKQEEEGESKEMEVEVAKKKSKRGRNWRPMSARFQEFQEEQWINDLADEERAVQRAILFPPPPPDPEDDKSSKSKSSSHKPSASQKLKLDDSVSNANSTPPNELEGNSLHRISSTLNPNLTPEGSAANTPTPEGHNNLLNSIQMEEMSGMEIETGLGGLGNDQAMIEAAQQYMEMDEDSDAEGEEEVMDEDGDVEMAGMGGQGEG